MPDPAAAPIFIIGTGRSGTTLLRLMLCAHPRIYVAHEASVYIWNALAPNSLKGMDFVDYYLRTFSFRWLRIPPDRIRAALRDDLPIAPDGRDTRALFTEVMRQKAALYERPRWGDKTPGHSGHLERLFADFPDARVIRMVRDPVATVRSLSRMPWASSGLIADALMVEDERRKTAPFADRILRVDLEELIVEPRAVMERVLDWVGEPWDEAVLNHAEHAISPLDMPPLPWLTPAAGRIGKPRSRRDDLSPAELRLVEHHVRGCLEETGRAPAELPTEPGRLEVWRLVVVHVLESLRFAWHYARMGFLLRNPDNFESERVDRIFARLNPPAWKQWPGLVMPKSPDPMD